MIPRSILGSVSGRKIQRGLVGGGRLRQLSPPDPPPADQQPRSHQHRAPCYRADSDSEAWGALGRLQLTLMAGTRSQLLLWNPTERGGFQSLKKDPTGVLISEPLCSKPTVVLNELTHLFC